MTGALTDNNSNNKSTWLDHFNLDDTRWRLQIARALLWRPLPSSVVITPKKLVLAAWGGHQGGAEVRPSLWIFNGGSCGILLVSIAGDYRRTPNPQPRRRKQDARHAHAQF